MQHADSFRAMDTGIDVIAESAAPFPPFGLFAGIHLLFEQQEERFSRFRPGSLLSRLNAGETIEDPFFAAACRLALEAHAFTGGLFNPLILGALRQAGYGVTFGSVSGGEPRPTHVPSPAECLAVEGTRVSLHGAQLDLGGIVKGWTVDLAAEMAANAGFAALVNAGGDLRATGTEHGAANGWFVQVDGPTDEPAWEGEVVGGLATSTTLKRAWRTSDGGRAHHLIDPRTGLPADSPFVQVSAWARETWRAECWAKAVLVGGHAAAGAARAAGVPVLAIAPAGAVLVAP